MLREPYDAGETITIPSLHMALSRVKEAFPQPPQTAAEVASGFSATFPGMPVLVIGAENPSEVRITVPHTEGERYRRAYVAVNEEGFALHMIHEEQQYKVVQGELIVRMQKGEGLTEERFLQEGDEILIDPWVVRAARAVEGWTIFQENSFQAESRIIPDRIPAKEKSRRNLL